MTTALQYRFPSTAWFEGLAANMADDAAHFRKLGTIDARAGIVMTGTPRGDRAWVLTFGAYTCDVISEATAAGAAEADFALTAPYTTWREMVENIGANGEADLRHTLNYLHFGQIELKASDQLQADLFFRVNGSLQAFFDGAAKLETAFDA
jgi:hypothetical protein